MNELYLKKENRNTQLLKVKNEMEKDGMVVFTRKPKLEQIVKGSTVWLRTATHRNQLLHPMYVTDNKEKPTVEDCGFGNTMYKTFFSKLYTIEPLYL